MQRKTINLEEGAISEKAQAEMIRKERVSNNAWHKFCRNKSAVIGLCIITRWKPKLILSLKKIGALINYGWKILASNIVETLYGDIVSLLIGKKYSPDMLAYYNRGKQYPNLIVGCVKEALQSVLLPAYSKQQDHPDFICQTMRRTLRISEMLVVPTMATLAIGAEPIVLLMLTEKWLLCVPYLQIACIFFAMLPITTVTLQGVSAIGRSDIFLKLSIAKRLIALLLVAVSVYLFDSVVAVAVVWALTGFLNIALNYKSIKQLFGYTAKMMASDLWPVLLASLVMLVAQISIRFLGLHSLITLLFQVAWGLLSYWLIIKALRYEGYADVIQLVKGMITKHSNKEM